MQLIIYMLFPVPPPLQPCGSRSQQPARYEVRIHSETPIRCLLCARHCSRHCKQGQVSALLIPGRAGWRWKSKLVSTWHIKRCLIHLGCYNKIPGTEWLKPLTFISRSSRRSKPSIKVSGESPQLGLQVAIFSLQPRMADGRDGSCVPSSSPKCINPHDIITPQLPRLLMQFTLEVSISTYKFGEHANIQYITNGIVFGELISRGRDRQRGYFIELGEVREAPYQ